MAEAGDGASRSGRALRLRSAALVVVLVAAGASLGPTPVTQAPSGASGHGSALTDLESRFLTTRPPVGPTWTVSIGPGSTAERLMMRTLQGVVNRTAARLYLIEPADAGAQRWIQEYEARGLVTVVGHTDIAGALDLFAHEAAGYVLGTEDEPWSLNVAATIAAAEGAVVATPELVPALEARGLTLLEDVRGRWTDPVAAYVETVAAYRDVLPYPGIAVLRQRDALFDFTVQQGIPTIFTRPDDPTWPQLSALIASMPAGQAVYGYLSDTGEEEAIAVGTLSAADLFLVPTDTTRNLSYQVAVGADLPREVTATPSGPVEECVPEDLNVVVALSDGDNLNVPLNHFSRTSNWASPRRGSFPMGWSMAPSLAILAPAAWDTYVREATAADELVSVIGYGYAAPVLLPDPAAFYRETFAAMDELGMRTFWSLGGGLESSVAGGWHTLDDAAAEGPPDGVLVGYGNGSGLGHAYWSPAGRPAFTSGTGYGDGPADLVAQVHALQTLAPDERPLVVFLAATNWTNPAEDLIDALAPLADEGVRFLTPAEATACMPETPEIGPPTPGPEECLPVGPITETGLALISETVAGEIARTPTRIAIEVAVSAPDSVAPGATIDHHATLGVDLERVAEQILAERVRPVIAGGFGAELAETAWLRLAFEDLTLRLVGSPATDPIGTPAASSTSPDATARWEPGGTVAVDLDAVAVDTRTPGDPFEVELGWQAVAAGHGSTSLAEVRPGVLSFDLDLTIGVVLGVVPLEGGARASWACEPATGVLAATTIEHAAPGSPTPPGSARPGAGPGDPAPTHPTARSTPAGGGGGAGVSPAHPARPVIGSPAFTG